MAKEKATITVDRATVIEVQRLSGVSGTSAAIDLALREFIRAERIRRDVAAYRGTEVTAAEIALATVDHDWSHLSDDTDWDALYPGPA